MKDITNVIKTAISSNVVWAINLFFSIVEKIKEKGFKISFWEGEENWASILVDDKIIGYVWKRYPLIFIISQYANEIRGCLIGHDYITVVETKNLVDKEFKINYDELKDRIDCAGLDDGFSIEDLWFNTNSI